MSLSDKPSLDKNYSARGEIALITWVGLVGNLLLSAIKFGIGSAAASQALVADAMHSLSDSVSDVFLLFGVGYWTEPADEEHPYGHGRIEALFSFCLGLTIAGVGLGILWNAVDSLHKEQLQPPGWWVFSVALLSIIIKESLYQWTMRSGKRLHSSALIANAWHHRSDALSSLPVALAVVAAHLNPTWTFVDPIAASIVAAMVIAAALHIIRPAFSVLIDTGANERERAHITDVAAADPDVRAVHALRTRFIGSGLQIDLHIQVDPELTVDEGHAIAGRVKKRILAEGPNVADVLIHIEPYHGNTVSNSASS